LDAALPASLTADTPASGVPPQFLAYVSVVRHAAGAAAGSSYFDAVVASAAVAPLWQVPAVRAVAMWASWPRIVACGAAAATVAVLASPVAVLFRRLSAQQYAHALAAALLAIASAPTVALGATAIVRVLEDDDAAAAPYALPDMAVAAGYPLLLLAAYATTWWTAAVPADAADVLEVDGGGGDVVVVDAPWPATCAWLAHLFPPPPAVTLPPATPPPTPLSPPPSQAAATPQQSGTAAASTATHTACTVCRHVEGGPGATYSSTHAVVTCDCWSPPSRARATVPMLPPVALRAVEDRVLVGEGQVIVQLRRGLPAAMQLQLAATAAGVAASTRGLTARTVCDYCGCTCTACGGHPRAAAFIESYAAELHRHAPLLVFDYRPPRLTDGSGRDVDADDDGMLDIAPPADPAARGWLWRHGGGAMQFLLDAVGHVRALHACAAVWMATLAWWAAASLLGGSDVSGIPGWATGAAILQAVAHLLTWRARAASLPPPTASAD